MECPDGFSLCSLTEDICYPTHRRCNYETYKGFPLNCPGLEHLQHCEAYICPHMLKCTFNYCIAVHMICNQISDCPDGEDEESCDHFVCPGLLKCRGDDLCVHPVNICDGVVHCLLFGDDESVCGVLSCPVECQCRGNAVQCQGPTNMLLLSNQTTAAILKALTIASLYQFQRCNRLVYLEISNCTFVGNTLFKNTLSGLKNMLQLKLAGNGITYIIPNAFTSMVLLVYIDLRHNNIKTISPLTFNNIYLLQNLDISYLHLTTLYESSFSGLISLQNLNLSFNRLRTLKHLTFVGLVNIRRIDLRFNLIQYIERNTFFSLKTNVIIYFQTNIYCCYLRSDHDCSVDNNSYRSAQCNSLFTSNLNAAVNVALSLVAMVVNIILQWYIRNMKKRSSSYILLLGHFAALNLLPHFYIIILVMMSLYYNNDYIYLSSIWLHSALCLFLNVLVTLGLIMSKIGIFLITLNQFIAVKFALQFNFKSVYLLSCLILIWISVILTVAVKQILSPVNNMFCFPYLADFSNTLIDNIYTSVTFVGIMLLIFGIASLNVSVIQHVRKSNQLSRSSKALNNERSLKRSFFTLMTVELLTMSFLLVIVLYSYFVPMHKYNVMLCISILIHSYVSIYTIYMSSKVFS